MKFYKLQATGNDFVLIQAGDDDDWATLACQICLHHYGVGADGLIVVQPSDEADVRMRLFNPDGSEAEACGNGLRCLARYAAERHMVCGGRLKVETMDGIRMVYVHDDRIVVDMGVPQFKSPDLPTREKLDIIMGMPITVGGERDKKRKEVIEGKEMVIACLSMGNPHAVCFMDDPVAHFPLEIVGPEVENHLLFPNRVNFEIANVMGNNKVVARVWERGVGETLSCGTGACAVAVAARLQERVSGDVNVALPGGTLTVSWDGVGEVMLSGPAEVVFSGEWRG